jgi:hypothetical protein
MDDYRVIMTGVVGFAVLGAACGIFPAVERYASIAFTVLFSLAGLAGATAIGRHVWAEITLARECREAAKPHPPIDRAPVRLP